MADVRTAQRLRNRRDDFTDRLRRGDTYGLLLAVLVMAYVVIALLERSPWERFAISFVMGAVVLLALHTSHLRGRPLQLAAILVAIVVLSTFVQAILGREGNDGTGYVMFVLVLMSPFVILARILRHEVIGTETILGALCVYVLLAIAFAGIYMGIDDLDSGRFFAQTGHKSNVEYLYFSFVTITTVGFGDLTARGDIGRVFVTFEALLGQIFLVTLVARLVSLYGTARARVEATPNRSAREDALEE